jgi:hypothetical protein
MKDNNVKDTFGGQSIGVTLKVTLERDGEIIETRCKYKDLVLDNFVNITMGLFRGNDATSIDYTRTNGGSIGVSPSYFFEGESAVICIGDSNNAPSYDDFNLINRIDTETVEQIGYSQNGNEMNVTAVATFNIDGTYAITEYGLQGRLSHNVMLYRDTETALNVIDGDILTVLYITQLN